MTLSLMSGKDALSSVDDFDFGGRPRLDFGIGVGGGCDETGGAGAGADGISGSIEPAATRLRGFASWRWGSAPNRIAGILFKDSGTWWYGSDHMMASFARCTACSWVGHFGCVALCGPLQFAHLIVISLPCLDGHS